MAQNQISTGFSMYSPRRLERLAFGAFQGAGIDQFTDPTAQNPSAFLNLTNVLPTITGAFQRRWGLTQQGDTLSRQTTQTRMFSYAAAADVSFSGTSDCRLLLSTDDQNVDIIYNELSSGTSTTPTPFTGATPVYGVTSREWFYVTNGADGGQKIDFSSAVTATLSAWGNPTPDSGLVIDNRSCLQVGFTNQAAGEPGGFTSVPTVTISGGGGSGATAVCTINAAGLIDGFFITAAGSGYTSAPSVSVSGGGGTFTGSAAAVVGSDITDTVSYQTVMAIVMTGPIILNSGRWYAGALKSSVSGHTGDFIYTANPITYPVSATYIAGLIDAQNPSQFLNQGVTSIGLQLSIIDTIPTGIDTFVLMASSDGGDLQHLYEVAQIPLSSFTVSGSDLIFTYFDTLPDTYNDTYRSGPTLLTQNLWVDVDANGNVIGINDNTPPPVTMNKPIVHKGRMFGTDGKSIFFSKSIDEVTTATGLITSKWEEAWPGSNQLDIAYDDERINALLSDGQVLYIGTSDNVFRLLGDSSNNFSIPEAIFRGVGVKSQDVWSVVYKDNIPAGYMWQTEDNKIMLSDFNTYNEIGKPIYPLILQLSNGITGLQSMSFGPYSLVFLTVRTEGNPTYFVFDSKNNGWYIWTRVAALPETSLPGNPLYSYTLENGIQRMFTILNDVHSTVSSNYLQYFDPTVHTDTTYGHNAANNINYLIETSWLNLADTATGSVLNEIEVWTDDPNMNLAVFKALNPFDFSGFPIVKTGPLVLGPLHIQKFFLAGSSSFGRYHKIQFYSDSTTGISATPTILRQFQFEYFPQTRT